jgi:hypothetical protein
VDSEAEPSLHPNVRSTTQRRGKTLIVSAAMIFVAMGGILIPPKRPSMIFKTDSND